MFYRCAVFIFSFFVAIAWLIPNAHARFLQTDPVGYEDQMNLYTYAKNSPTNFNDPTGQCSEPASESEIICDFEDWITDNLEPIIEELMEASGQEVVPEDERDPEGVFDHEAEENTSEEEAKAVAVVVVGAAIDRFRGKSIKGTKKKQDGGREKTRGANKRDRKQVDDAAKKAGVSDRRGFGKFVEQKKKQEGRGGSDNYTFEELVEIAEEFIDNGGG